MAEDMGNAEDPFVYKIFYKHQEIEKTQAMQNQDMFQDLISRRKEAIFESGLLLGGTKINISDFAPKPVVILESKSKKQGRQRRQTADIFDQQGHEDRDGDFSPLRILEEPS